MGTRSTQICKNVSCIVDTSCYFLGKLEEFFGEAAAREDVIGVSLIRHATHRVLEPGHFKFSADFPY